MTTDSAPPSPNCLPTPTLKYWGGHSAFSNQIRQLKATDFATLVENYFNYCRSLHITRAEYHALPDEERKRIKDGPYVIPATMTHGTATRKTQHASSIALVCIDIDDSEPAGRMLDDIQRIHQTFPHDYVIHHTTSSTPDAPRLRVIVSADNLPVETYKTAVRCVLDQLGLPRSFAGTKESSVLVQPMYRPTMFADANDHPVVSSRTDLGPLRFSNLETLPPDKPSSVPDTAFSYPADVQLGSLPLMDVTPEDVREPLNQLDPDCDYMEWIIVCAALKHQFRTPEEARQAFDLFDDWSSRGTKYRDSDETRAKWTSFRPDPALKAPVTLRSLFALAIKAGWSPAPMARKVAASFDEWLEGADETDVLQDGIRRIAETPFPSSSSDALMAGKLVRKLKAAGAVVTTTAIIKDVNKARRDANARTRAAKLSEAMPGWLRGWVFVAPTNLFRHVDKGTELSPAAFNNYFSAKLMPKDGDTPNGRPEVLPADFALNQALIPRVEVVTYDPRHRGEEPIYIHNGRHCLNLYRASSVPLEDPARSDEARALFDRLLTALLGVRHAGTMMDYLSYCVQFPGEKIRWAPVIQSGQGAGKGVMMTWVRGACGKDNVGVINPTAMSSSFNDWAFGKHLLNVDELHTAGGVRSVEMNRIKDIISNDRITLVAKYRNTEEVDNVVNVIVTTNYLDTLHLDESDRRYWVVESPLQVKADILALTDTGLYGDLMRFCADHPGAVRSMFLEHKISKSFRPDGHAPDTTARINVVRNSRSAIETRVGELIDDPEHPTITRDVICYNDLEDACSYIKGPPLYRTLGALGYVRHGEGVNPRFRIGGRRTTVWVSREFDPDIYDPVEILLKLSARSEATGVS